MEFHGSFWFSVVFYFSNLYKSNDELHSRYCVMEILSNSPRCTHPHLSLMYHTDNVHVEDSVGSDIPVGSNSSHVESFIPCVRDVAANIGTHDDRVEKQIVVSGAISNVGVSVDDVGVESRAMEWQRVCVLPYIGILLPQ